MSFMPNYFPTIRPLEDRMTLGEFVGSREVRVGLLVNETKIGHIEVDSMPRAFDEERIAKARHGVTRELARVLATENPEFAEALRAELERVLVLENGAGR